MTTTTGDVMAVFVPITSTDLDAVAYDTTTETLDVRFKKTVVVRRFFNVGQTVHRGLLTAASPGRFYHANIKNHYRSIVLA